MYSSVVIVTATTIEFALPQSLQPATLAVSNLQLLQQQMLLHAATMTYRVHIVQGGPKK